MKCHGLGCGRPELGGKTARMDGLPWVGSSQADAQARSVSATAGLGGLWWARQELHGLGRERESRLPWLLSGKWIISCGGGWGGFVPLSLSWQSVGRADSWFCWAVPGVGVFPSIYLPPSLTPHGAGVLGREVSSS